MNKQMWYVHAMEYYKVFKRNDIQIWVTWVNMNKTVLSERIRVKRPFIIGFHLYEMSRRGKSIKQKAACAGRWLEKNRSSWLFSGREKSFYHKCPSMQDSVTLRFPQASWSTYSVNLKVPVSAGDLSFSQVKSFWLHLLQIKVIPASFSESAVSGTAGLHSYSLVALTPVCEHGFLEVSASLNPLCPSNPASGASSNQRLREKTSFFKFNSRNLKDARDHDSSCLRPHNEGKGKKANNKALNLVSYRK